MTTGVPPLTSEARNRRSRRLNLLAQIDLGIIDKPMRLGQGQEHMGNKGDNMDSESLEYSMDWFCWDNFNRKPCFLPLNMGVSCKFPPKPIHWSIADIQWIWIKTLMISMSIKTKPSMMI